MEREYSPSSKASDFLHPVTACLYGHLGFSEAVTQINLELGVKR